MRHDVRLTLGAIVVLLASCTTASKQTQGTYSLPLGSTISVRANADDTTEVRVMIPPGHPGEGTWSTRDPVLVPAARLAMEHLNESNVTVVIEVDRAGNIVSIHESTGVR